MLCVFLLAKSGNPILELIPSSVTWPGQMAQVMPGHGPCLPSCSSCWLPGLLSSLPATLTPRWIPTHLACTVQPMDRQECCRSSCMMDAERGGQSHSCREGLRASETERQRHRDKWTQRMSRCRQWERAKTETECSRPPLQNGFRETSAVAGGSRDPTRVCPEWTVAEAGP